MLQEGDQIYSATLNMTDISVGSSGRNRLGLDICFSDMG